MTNGCSIAGDIAESRPFRPLFHSSAEMGMRLFIVPENNVTDTLHSEHALSREMARFETLLNMRASCCSDERRLSSNASVAHSVPALSSSPHGLARCNP